MDRRKHMYVAVELSVVASKYWWQEGERKREKQKLLQPINRFPKNGSVFTHSW